MIKESLAKLGITDYRVLPMKTRIKIEDYERYAKTPIGNDKNGEPSPKKLARLDGLVEDIIFEAKLYLKQKKQNGSGDANPQAAEKPNVKQKTQTDEPPAEPPATEKKGFLEDLLGI